MSVTYRPPVYFSVKDFGAVGDGVTDDTTAIQNAIDAAQQVAGRVYLPATGAVYKITSSLVVSRAVAIVGENTWGTYIQAAGFSTGQFALSIDGTVNPNLEGVEVSSLTLLSDDGVPDLIQINRASNSSFTDIGLRNCRHGIVITGNRTFSNLFDRVVAVTAISGNTILFDDFTGGGHLTFTGCSFAGYTGFYISPDSALSQLTLMSCNFEGCTTNGFYGGGDVRGLSFLGCRAEKCLGGATFNIRPEAGNAAYGISISGCFFETDAEAYAVSLGGAAGEVRGFSITGNYAKDYSDCFVRLNGDGQSGVVSGNRVDNVPAAVNVIRPGVIAINNEAAGGAFEPVWNPSLSTSAYAVSNLTVDRNYDASSTTLAEVSNVLGTLIDDLKDVGIIK